MKTNILKNIYFQKHLPNIIILFLCLTPVILSLIMVTDGNQSKFNIFGYYINFNSSCVFNELTGYDCPTCKMTRSFIYIGKFDFYNALNMKISGVLLYLYLVFQIIYRLYLLINNKEYLEIFKFQLVSGLVVIFVNLTEFIFQFY
jgi:hypothetical protein